MIRLTKLIRFILGTFLSLSLLAIVVCQVSLRGTSHHYEQAQRGDGVALREFPFPFRCALSLSSDIDGTTSLSEFLTIQEFLNTRNDTPLGQGLGLEIGNTFFVKGEDFSFLSPNPEDRSVILELIRSGYVDGLHSLDEPETRAEVERMVEALSAAGVAIDVWINHGVAPTNLGPCDTCFGDNAEKPAYHADVSLDRLGYWFVWLGAVSGVVGQARPISAGSFLDAFDSRHPMRSLLNNVAQEQIKFLLATLGDRRYAMRKDNELVRVTQLDDGQSAFEFTRSNFCYYGLWGQCATAAGLADSLREAVLDALVDVGGYMIVYTHLGKNEGYPYLPEPTVEALRRVAERHRAGEIWVTTTSRLLRYYVNKKYLHWDVEHVGDQTNILIDSTRDPVRGEVAPRVGALGGITFYINDPGKTRVFLRGEEIEVTSNPSDVTGRASVTIPLQPLETLDGRMTEYKSRGYF